MLRIFILTILFCIVSNLANAQFRNPRVEYTFPGEVLLGDIDHTILRGTISVQTDIDLIKIVTDGGKTYTFPPRKVIFFILYDQEYNNPTEIWVSDMVIYGNRRYHKFFGVAAYGELDLYYTIKYGGDVEVSNNVRKTIYKREFYVVNNEKEIIHDTALKDYKEKKIQFVKKLKEIPKKTYKGIRRLKKLDYTERNNLLRVITCYNSYYDDEYFESNPLLRIIGKHYDLNKQ